MSQTVYSTGGQGFATIYTAPSGRNTGIETLTFTVTADATAGIHRVRVRFVDNAGNIVGTFDDQNDSGPSQTTIYTYGLGLNASACTTATGWAVTDALPWTQLGSGYTVTVETINDNGVQVAGDTIEAVVLQVDSPQAQSFALEPIYTMPSEAAA